MKRKYKRPVFRYSPSLSHNEYIYNLLVYAYQIGLLIDLKWCRTEVGPHNIVNTYKPHQQYIKF